MTNIKQNYRINFFADDSLINSIKDLLIEVGLKPTKKRIEKIIKEGFYSDGEGFLNNTLHVLIGDGEYQDIDNFYKRYKDC